MFIERRKAGRSIKYYLIHSYREEGEVRKIRRYLGQNLAKGQLKEEQEKAKSRILGLLEELTTEVFLFRLTKGQIKKLNAWSSKIRIAHFDQRQWQRFTEEFVFNTNAIEGSTIRREEVPRILRNPVAETAEERETKGVANAVNYIKKAREDLSIELLMKLHELCFKGSKGFAGQLRHVEVAVVDAQGRILHRGVPAAQLELALRDMISWYKENKRKFRPLVLAAILHDQFEYIHPFQDGNGRAGRLLLNFILLRNGYPPINISLDDRAEYYRTLQEYEKKQNVRPTVEFLVEQYEKTLRMVTTKKKNA